MISKANITGQYVNKTQSACYKSLEIGLGKFMKLLGIASAIVIVGFDLFFFSKFILVVKDWGHGWCCC
jgi:hypothetical protein